MKRQQEVVYFAAFTFIVSMLILSEIFGTRIVMKIQTGHRISGIAYGFNESDIARVRKHIDKIRLEMKRVANITSKPQYPGIFNWKSPQEISAKASVITIYASVCRENKKGGAFEVRGLYLTRGRSPRAQMCPRTSKKAPDLFSHANGCIRYFLHILFAKKTRLNLNLPPLKKLSHCSVSH